MARPKIQLDDNHVEELSALYCTNEEIAVMLGVSCDTLDRRFAEAIKKGRMKGAQSLRRLQWASANNGNVTMQIWLGKQMLGQKDKSELEQSGTHTYIFQGVRF